MAKRWKDTAEYARFYESLPSSWQRGIEAVKRGNVHLDEFTEPVDGMDICVVFCPSNFGQAFHSLMRAMGAKIVVVNKEGGNDATDTK